VTSATVFARCPANSVDTVITSPPYLQLRNYAMGAQIGLEDDVTAWVEALRDVGRELARVLKPTGGWWLNLGDSYSRDVRTGAPPKSLLLGPERLALALVADGWTIRNKVIWAKPNPMPASVRDRLACTWVDHPQQGDLGETEPDAGQCPRPTGVHVGGRLLPGPVSALQLRSRRDPRPAPHTHHQPTEGRHIYICVEFSGDVGAAATLGWTACRQ
jgi:hypothetical protein